MTAKRILESSVILAGRIAKIGEDQVTFDFPSIENFIRFTNKIWVSMIAEKNNN